MICKIIILFSNLNIFQKKIRKKMFIFFLWHPDEKSNSNYFSLHNTSRIKKGNYSYPIDLWFNHLLLFCILKLKNMYYMVYKSRKILFKKHLSCHSFPSLEIYTIILHYIFCSNFFILTILYIMYANIYYIYHIRYDLRKKYI